MYLTTCRGVAASAVAAFAAGTAVAERSDGAAINGAAIEAGKPDIQLRLLLMDAIGVTMNPFPALTMKHGSIIREKKRRGVDEE